MDQATASAARATQVARKGSKCKNQLHQISRNLGELFVLKTSFPLTLRCGKNHCSWQSLMPSQPESGDKYSVDFGFFPDQNAGVLENKVSV